MADPNQVIPPAMLLEHPDPSATVNASMYTMLAIATLFLALRLYCKTLHTRYMMWLDDYLLVAGWVTNIISHALASKMLSLGFGQSMIVTPQISTYIYVADNFHKISLGLTKTSFAVTLLRISTGWQVYMIWFLVVSMNIQFVVHIILTWRITCGAVLDETPHLPMSCWPVESAIALGLFGGFYSALSDFALALLPWKIIMGLNMKKHEKLGVATAMSIGIFAGIAGIMKDPWYMAIFWIWCQAEPNATIMAASIPSFRVLVKNLRSSRKEASYHANQYIKSDNMSKFHNNMTANDEYGAMDANSDHSDHGILPTGTDIAGKAGITRTREVKVEYNDSNDARAGRDDEDIEMVRWQTRSMSRSNSQARK
ncbi:hypothetical protein F5X68DRAFT_272639 [Plectosphaerella plurivora]|uniref:Rhodopsin domain-containing protein n=1 Tax=Plectosphaerella plurivora TaxID=936078 RepID=A0A9P9ACB6_9PEZI|nr:hypothetical protein F5X68DRAFT_272639 [Plectosphaerella plurivora]